jgi:hypothetical protein
VVCGLVGVPNAGAVPIDGFDDGEVSLVALPGIEQDMAVVGAGILGGERDVRVFNFGFSLGSALVATDLLGSGSFAYSQGAGTFSQARVIWDGVDGNVTNFDPTGLGGVDLTEGGHHTAVRFRIASQDLPVATAFLDLWSNNSDASRADFGPLPGGIAQPAELIVPFSRFVTVSGAGADPANVGAISLLLVGNQAHTLQIDGIDTVPRIDSFDGESVLLEALPGLEEDTVVVSAGVVGGERDMRVFNFGSSLGTAVLTSSGSGYVYSQGPDTTSQAALTWDGVDGSVTNLSTNGLNGFDLTDGGQANAVRLRVDFQDLPVGATLNLYSGATDQSQAPVDLGGGIATPADVIVPLASFVTVGGAGVDPTAVGAMRLSLVGTQAHTLELAFIDLVFIADFDGDGIDNAVDGTFSVVFDDESLLASDAFTDEHLGGTTSGTIVDRADLDVRVEDVGGAAGVRLRADGGVGTAIVDVCGATMFLTDGDVVTITCGSLIAEVISGPVEFQLADDVLVTADSGAIFTATAIGGGAFEIVNAPESTGAVVVVFGDEVVVLDPGEAVATVIAIVIDIKPGSAENVVNRKSKGVVPVAVLTTVDFDASDIDLDTVVFGPDQATPVHATMSDANADGEADLLLHFRTQEIGLEPDTAELTLTAETIDGHAVAGTDAVTVLH